MRPPNLDMDALRAFVTGTDLGSYARAAARLGRSPSAVSLQLRRLEDQVGCPLVLKRGRGLALTESGEALLGHARRLLELNDAAFVALRDASIAGEVRIGLPQDVAETHFPAVLARFARLYPNVRIQARVERSEPLRAAFAAGELDLVLHWCGEAGTGETLLPEVPMIWVGPRGTSGAGLPAPLPLVLFDAPCTFRRDALAALDRAGRPWHVTFSTPSLSGLWAAVAAGLGVTVRTAHGLPPTLGSLEGEGLPPLPRISLALLRAAPREDDAAARLGAIVCEAFSKPLA